MAFAGPDYIFAFACLAGLIFGDRLTGRSSIGRVRFGYVLSLTSACYVMIWILELRGVGDPAVQVYLGAIGFALALATAMRCRDLGLRPETALLFIYVPAGILVPALCRGLENRSRLPRLRVADGWPAILCILVLAITATAAALFVLADTSRQAFHVG